MGRRSSRAGATPVVALVATFVALAALLFTPTPVGTQFRALVHFHAPSRVLPAVPVPHGGGHYRFEKTQPGGDDPVTYSPCKSIPYVVNPSGGPRSLDFITRAVAVISRASGLSFSYRGTTDDTNFEHRKAGDPVLIGFVAPGSIKGMGVDSSHIGLGGSTAYDLGFRHLMYRTGMVALRSDWFDAEGTTDAQRRAVVMHELGHVLGLDHVADENELMAAENVGLTHLGPGDREGLALLGRGECL